MSPTTHPEVIQALRSGDVRLLRDSEQNPIGFLVADKVIHAFNKAGIASSELTPDSAKYCAGNLPAQAKWQTAHYIEMGDLLTVMGGSISLGLIDKPNPIVIDERVLEFKAKEVPMPMQPNEEGGWVEEQTGANFKGRA